jgi:hypothetical protein
MADRQGGLFYLPIFFLAYFKRPQPLSAWLQLLWI